MKILVVLSILFTVVKSQGCLWCITCPAGTYRYAPGCDYLRPEPTCKNPYPVKNMTWKICDYEACYCNPPTVRNEATKQCVRLRDCYKIPVTPVTPVTPMTPITPVTPFTPRTPITPKVPVRPY